MAACGAANYFSSEGILPNVFEKNEWQGGHTASWTTDGFTFDEGPHISFTKDERIQNLFAKNINEQYEIIHARVNNYWQGHWIKHPAQCNLYGLPADLIVDVIRDFIDSDNNQPENMENYAEWLLASYGKTFAEKFPMQYGLKYHTVNAHQMSTDWLGPRLYKPNIKEVLRGAIAKETPNVHYVSDFRYPSHGGFASYVTPFLHKGKINLSHELQNLDPNSKTLHFENGKVTPYDAVVSSIPLPELISRIDSVPSKVTIAAHKLAVTSCVLVNLGLSRNELSTAHWTYFYDADYTLSRLSCPHMLSPNNAPSGHGSFQAEVYFSKKYKPLDKSLGDITQAVISDLRRCGLIRNNDDIVFSEARHIEYANIIFDHDRALAVETIHGYLDEIGVQWCGRYGEWGYEWTDQAFKSGELAAEKALLRLTSAA